MPCAPASSAAAASDCAGAAITRFSVRDRRGSPGDTTPVGSARTAATEAGVAIDQRARMARASAGGRGIRHGGAGADEGRIIARHIRDHQGQHPRREGRSRKLAALHPAQVLAQQVHRLDRRARGEQACVDRLFFGQGDSARRLHQQRRRAARDQGKHEIIRPEARDHREHPRRRRLPGGVWHRMRSLDDLDASGRAAIAIAGDHQPLAGAPGRLDRLCHPGRGLARPDHQDAARRFRRQLRGDHPHRIGHRDAAVEKRAQKRRGPGCGRAGHAAAPFRQCGCTITGKPDMGKARRARALSGLLALPYSSRKARSTWSEKGFIR